MFLGFSNLHSQSVADESAYCLQCVWFLNQPFIYSLQVMDRIEKSLGLLEEKERQTVYQATSWVPGVKRRPPLSKRAVKLMESWYQANLHHPYPSATVCEALALSGAITVEQVKKWFGNKRSRKCNTRPRSEIAKRKYRCRQGLQDCDLLRAIDFSL